MSDATVIRERRSHPRNLAVKEFIHGATPQKCRSQERSDFLRTEPDRQGAALCAGVLQGTGEGRFLHPGAVQAAARLRGAERLQDRRGVYRRRNRQEHRAHQFRRDGRISTQASRRAGGAGGEDRPALSQSQGLGDARRVGYRDPPRQGGHGALGRLALVGKVHARHQGADGQELHRQPLRGSAQGADGEGRTGHLAIEGAAGLSQRHRDGRQEDHRAGIRRWRPWSPSCSSVMRPAIIR